MKSPHKQKSFEQMTTAELQEATQAFDAPITKFPPGKPMTAAQLLSHHAFRIPHFSATIPRL